MWRHLRWIRRSATHQHTRVYIYKHAVCAGNPPVCTEHTQQSSHFIVRKHTLAVFTYTHSLRMINVPLLHTLTHGAQQASGSTQFIKWHKCVGVCVCVSVCVGWKGNSLYADLTRREFSTGVWTLKGFQSSAEGGTPFERKRVGVCV